MEHLYEKALESAEYIKAHTTKRPKVAVVLGSGLGNLTQTLPTQRSCPTRTSPTSRYPQWQGTKALCWQADWAKKKSMPWKAASTFMRATA